MIGVKLTIVLFVITVVSIIVITAALIFIVLAGRAAMYKLMIAKLRNTVLVMLTGNGRNMKY